MSEAAHYYCNTATQWTPFDIEQFSHSHRCNLGGPKSRRRTQQGFLGADKFLEKDGKLKAVARKRVGIAGYKAPAREHTEVFAADGTTKIGEVTSGGFGPTFGKPLAMG